jgi:hypothetical protein
MSTFSTEEHKQLIEALNMIDRHAMTCEFCKQPGTHNRGICQKNLELHKAAADAYDAVFSTKTLPI